jgi:hypothetical protein
MCKNIMVMRKVKTLFLALLLVLFLVQGFGAMDQRGDEKLWQEVYAAREKYYESSFGKLPSEIAKMANLIGVWPGGGLMVIPATKLGPDVWVYTTFGFTNPDMPTTITLVDSKGNNVSRQNTLKRKKNIRTTTNRPGHGYEMLVITKERAEWPLGFLQWVANAEILNDADLLSRVENYGGLTVEEIQVDDAKSINVLIAKAQTPLPSGAALPNGKMELLVATVITEDEMRWSMTNGRSALLAKLQSAGVGQISDLKRKSVLK